jgi:TPP-dependent pyruvate/acetoin dehydrogenase alpha subunit
MARIRAFETVVAEAKQVGDLPGLLHLSIGGEAVATGVLSCLDERDRIFSGHRPHGHFLAAGVEPRSILAELAGKESGLCRGRGGTMHLMSPRAVLATGVVGGTLPIAVGAALNQPSGSVVVVFFGDGAVQNGAFHESMNLASLWNAPVLFVCENNGWAEFSTREQHTKVGGVHRYGEIYHVASAEVDGSDVEAVTNVFEALLGPVRSGAGPALLECHIARLRPHYEGDSRPTSTDGDPLAVTASRLIAGGISIDEITDIRERELQEARQLMREVLAEGPADPAGDVGLLFARAV